MALRRDQQADHQPARRGARELQEGDRAERQPRGVPLPAAARLGPRRAQREPRPHLHRPRLPGPGPRRGLELGQHRPEQLLRPPAARRQLRRPAAPRDRPRERALPVADAPAAQHDPDPAEPRREQPVPDQLPGPRRARLQRVQPALQPQPGERARQLPRRRGQHAGRRRDPVGHLQQALLQRRLQRLQHRRLPREQRPGRQDRERLRPGGARARARASRPRCATGTWKRETWASTTTRTTSARSRRRRPTAPACGSACARTSARPSPSSRPTCTRTRTSTSPFPTPTSARASRSVARRRPTALKGSCCSALRKRQGRGRRRLLRHRLQRDDDLRDRGPRLRLHATPPPAIRRSSTPTSTPTPTSRSAKNLTLTLGASGDLFDETGEFLESIRIPGLPPDRPFPVEPPPVLGEKNQFNPKAGLSWSLKSGTTLRAAWFKTLKRTLVTDQTLEPTQVSGFNQFFDDPSATESEVWGAAIDQKFGKQAVRRRRVLGAGPHDPAAPARGRRHVDAVREARRRAPGARLPLRGAAPLADVRRGVPVRELRARPRALLLVQQGEDAPRAALRALLPPLRILAFLERDLPQAGRRVPAGRTSSTSSPATAASGSSTPPCATGCRSATASWSPA